jgi:arylsulfatase A-like enzyme
MTNFGLGEQFRSLIALVTVIATLLVLPHAAPAQPQPSRPNILFIITDDHAYQAISAYGSKLNQTPNIDRLAREGVRFDRCYVTNSICAPSRATILTGKYSHKNGHYDNYSEFDGGQTTFPKLLRAGGYQTALIGKWHLKSDPTGFDHWDILPGQGKYYRPDFTSPAGKVAIPGYVTDIITGKADQWLRRERDPQRPFLLMVQHKAPHRPWDPAAEKLTKYADQDLPEPKTLFDDYATRGKAARDAEMRIDQMNPTTDLKLWDANDPDRTWLYNHMTPDERAAWERHVDPRLDAFRQANPTGQARTRWFYQLYIKDYLRCVDSVDEGIGRLLKTLDELNLADNTIVVYTSDQGFYLGEHGWFDKRFMYEQSLRTPLVVRWPGVVRPATGEQRIVSNVDFAQTFLEAARVPSPNDMQGRSLLPILRGGAPADWRRAFYYHYYEGVERDHKVCKHEGVTTGRAKLIHFYPLNEWEMYDLENDPDELNNIYGRAEHAELQKELTAELERLRRELGVPPR